MDKFSLEIKIAELRILKDIINADAIVREREIAYMFQVANEMGINNEELEKVDQMVTLKALSIIRQLDDMEKNEFAKRMGLMIVADADINYNEVKLYNEVCESCAIEKGFRVEDYPSYSMSGPFDEMD